MSRGTKNVGIVALLSFFCLNSLLFGQAGSLDPTFTFTNTYAIECVALQTDGKIVVVNNSLATVFRLNPNGTRDTNFQASSVQRKAKVLAIQPDGKIVVGGESQLLMRLQPNGLRDSTFKWPDTYGSGVCSGVGLRADGKILASFDQVTAAGAPLLVRLMADGTLDPNFPNSTQYDLRNSPGILDGSVIHMLPDDEFLWMRRQYGFVNYVPEKIHGDGSPALSFKLALNRPSGILHEGDGLTYFAGSFGLMRATNGIRDEYWGYSAPVFNGSVNAIVGQRDGKLIVGGAFSMVNGTNCNRLARIFGDGQLDRSFISAIPNNVSSITTLTLTPAGKLLVGSTDGRMWRLNLDTPGPPQIFEPLPLLNAREGETARFTIKATVMPDTVYTWYLGATNRLAATTETLILSNVTAADEGVYRVEISNPFGIATSSGRLQVEGTRMTPGHLIASFASGQGANGVIHTMIKQADGKLIVGGEFTSFDGEPRPGIARLHSDGTIDSSFTTEGALSNTFPRQAIIHSAVVEPNGKVLVGGAFTSIGGHSRNHLARLMPNGALDFSFDPGTNAVLGSNAWVAIVRLQHDGKVLAVARYNNVYGAYWDTYRLLRMLPSGVADEEFRIPSDGSIVQCLEVDQAGRIVLRGHNGVLRFLPNGTNDLRLPISPLTVAVRDDNSIVAIDYASLKTFSENGMELKTTGFGESASTINAFTEDHTGGFFLAGVFNTQPRPLRRITWSGGQDDIFASRLSINGRIWAVLAENDGTLTIAGGFTQVNGRPYGRIAKLQWSLPLLNPRVDEHGFSFTADVEPAKWYYLETRDLATSTNWSTLNWQYGGNTGSTTLIFHDRSPTNQSRMYRLRY
jgi:uncharacterized delta-60 repeat protein